METNFHLKFKTFYKSVLFGEYIALRVIIIIVLEYNYTFYCLSVSFC